MQEKKSTVGPRGWAMLTLLGGATLASPFLRPPSVEVDSAITESPLARSTSNPQNSVGQLASARSRTESAAFPTAEELSAFSRQQMEIAAGSEPSLPSWAAPPSPLDALISQGAAPPWNAEPPQTRIQPLRPWNSSNARNDRLPSTQAPLAIETNLTRGVQASPWESPRGAAPPVPSTIDSSSARGDAWPEKEIPQLPMLASAPERSGPTNSLTGATLVQNSGNPNPPPSLSASQRRPQYVFQPGYQPASPKP